MIDEKTIENVIENVVKSEYGGRNVFTDSKIILKARVSNRMIEVFVVGKWRPQRYYGGSGKNPSKKIVDEVKHSVMVNTGWNKSDRMKDKEMEFEWID